MSTMDPHIQNHLGGQHPQVGSSLPPYHGYAGLGKHGMTRTQSLDQESQDFHSDYGSQMMHDVHTPISGITNSRVEPSPNYTVSSIASQKQNETSQPSVVDYDQLARSSNGQDAYGNEIVAQAVGLETIPEDNDKQNMDFPLFDPSQGSELSNVDTFTSLFNEEHDG